MTNQLHRITFHDGTEEIGDGTLYGCTHLAQAYLPSTLRSIGTNAFRFCNDLQTLQTPDSLEESDLARSRIPAFSKSVFHQICASFMRTPSTIATP